MPQNRGKPPPVALCDIRFRNGHVIRSTKPSKWRWDLGNPKYPKDWDFDIVQWKEVG